MESALCLHYGPLPSLTQRIPSTVSTTRATRPYFTFSHSSLMLSNASTSQLKGHDSRPIIKQKAPSVRASAFPMGGKAALQSFLDMSAYLASSNIDFQKGSTFILIPSRPSVEDVAVLKMKAMQLLRSGKGTEAEELLQQAIQNCEDDPEPAYNLSIALAEVLIFQAKYEEAHKCLKDQLHPSDARFHLYKAIVCTMLDNNEEAKNWWEKFITIIEGGLDIPIDIE